MVGEARAWRGLYALTFAGAVMVIGQAAAQSVKELERELAEKERAVAALRVRINDLRSQGTVERSSVQPVPSVVDIETDEAANRALERTLVREGAAVLPPYQLQLTPSVGGAIWDKNRPIIYRHGVTGGIAASLGLPWGSQFDVSLPLHSTKTVLGRDSGVGDLTLGLSKQWLNESEVTPAVVASIGVALPTDHFFQSRSSEGDGNWRAVSAAVSLSKRFDPVVLFGSAYTSKAAGERPGGNELDFAPTIGVRFGGLIALSPDMSLNTALNFSRRGETEVNGVAVNDSDVVNGTFSLGLSTVLTNSLMLTTTGSIRVMGTVPNFALGISLPYRF
jgi:hypothetical protein